MLYNAYVYTLRITLGLIVWPLLGIVHWLGFCFQWCADCLWWARGRVNKFVAWTDDRLPHPIETAKIKARREAERLAREREANAHWGKLQKGLKQRQETAAHLRQVK